MKAVYITFTKTEYLFLYFSIILFLCLVTFYLKQYQTSVRTVSPFYMNLNVGEENQDPDNNLSGNSGISMDYYTKQIEQFLNSVDSSL